MTDLSRFIADLCADLDESSTTPLSTLVETLSSATSSQVTVSSHGFHSFRSFHSETDIPTACSPDGADDTILAPPGSRATSSYAGDVEIAERVERRAKNLAETALSFFPLSLKEVERVERKAHGCGRPTLDLNHAAPQCSDWWTGPAVAEVDRLASHPHPVQPSPTAHLSGPQAWRDGLALLDRWAPPCPGFRTGEWESLHRTIAHFMDHAAVEAAARGWTMLDLFGVHRDAGAAAVDSCGALMLPLLKTVSAVTTDAITFGPLVYRRRPMPQAVVAWEFAGGGWQEDRI